MFAGPGPWMTPWMPQVLPNVVRLVEMQPARTLFTRFVPPSRPEDLPGAWVRYYRRWPDMTLENLDPEMVLLVPELERMVPPARIVEKRVYSPWIDGALRSQLRETGTTTLVVSGAETEVCVLATVLGAIDFGFRVIIAADAICSSADPTHDAMLAIYRSRYGMQVEVATTAEIETATCPFGT